MKILDRYILRSFFYSYLMSLLVLISLYVVLDLFVNFDEFTESGKPAYQVIRDIIDFYSPNVPLYFSQLSGVITAFAACTTLARLQRQNEITAMLASGTSLYRIAAPIILASVLVNSLLVLDQEYLIPAVAPKLARPRDDVAGARSYGIWCVPDDENRLISATVFLPKEQRIRNLYIIELTRQANHLPRLGDVITATSARWDAARHGWDLTGKDGEGYGVRIKVAEAVAGGITSEAPVKRVPITFYPSKLTPEALLAHQTAQWVQFLSVRQLNQLLRRSDMNVLEIEKIKHGRFTLPLNNMILLILGLSFFLSRIPENVLTQGAKALGTCAAAFLITFVGQQMMGASLASTDLPAWLTSPALPAWLPILFFGPIAALLMENVKT
jgi:lipopolysaccharide export system permease protein